MRGAGLAVTSQSVIHCRARPQTDQPAKNEFDSILQFIAMLIKCTIMKESPFAIIGDISRLARRSFDARAREIAVTRPQWQVLVVLNRHEGVNQGGLAELLDVEPITVCRMVDRLQEADLVERRPDPADRRSWRLFLTAKAAELLAQLQPLGEQLEQEAFAGIDSAERALVIALLERVRNNLAPRANPKMVSHG